VARSQAPTLLFSCLYSGSTDESQPRYTLSSGFDTVAIMDEAAINLFSYGTLQLESVQISSFGRRLRGAPDSMPGFRKDMIEIIDPDVLKASGERYHPIVSPSGNPADEIAGMVFQVTAAELAAADTYEVGDYQRIKVRLKSGKDAWVYVKA
jgi:hypothetical protein